MRLQFRAAECRPALKRRGLPRHFAFKRGRAWYRTHSGRAGPLSLEETKLQLVQAEIGFLAEIIAALKSIRALAKLEKNNIVAATVRPTLEAKARAGRPQMSRK